MGQLDLAKSKYQEALEIRPDFFGSCRGLAYILALEENYAETERWLEEIIVKASEPEKWEGRWLKAYYDYFLGRWEESRVAYLAIKDRFETSDATTALAGTNSIMGHLYADRGEYDLARQAFQGLIDWRREQSSSQDALPSVGDIYLLGWVDLKQGRLDSAKGRLNEIELLLAKTERANQEFASMRYPLLEAEIYLADGQFDKAIEAGKKIVQADFPGMSITNLLLYNNPFLKDVLAKAYWKNGDLDKAIAEYSRLTTINPKSQIRYLIHPLYHYRFGRVYEENGEKEKAAGEYEKFLKYWKDADSTHPELADAQKRLSSLKPQINK